MANNSWNQGKKEAAGGWKAPKITPNMPSVVKENKQAGFNWQKTQQNKKT